MSERLSIWLGTDKPKKPRVASSVAYRSKRQSGLLFHCSLGARHGLAFGLGGKKPVSDSDRPMAEGKRQLFASQATAADRSFTEAAKLSPGEPLPRAYRSWAIRLTDKAAAVSLAEAAVCLDRDCAEAHMSLALAHATAPTNFESAFIAYSIGRRLKPTDAYGSVLQIGVYLLFFDAIGSIREDADGFQYEFMPTTLRNAADYLLSGHHSRARSEFLDIFEFSGRHLPGALGIAASAWAMDDRKRAYSLAKLVVTQNLLKDTGMKTAIRILRDASI